MKKIILILILITSSYLSAQNTVGILLNTEDSLNGYTLFSPRTQLTPRYTYLINNCGEIVNQWESTFPLFSTDYLREDGSLFRSVIDNQSTLDIPGNTGRIEHLDWDGTLIWGLTYSDTDFSFHHDYVVLENGNILMLVAHRKTLAEAIQEGRDPSTIANNELYEERVIEIEPIGTDGFNIVWEWRSWDHLIQDFDNTKDNFGVVGDHPELVDVNFGVSFGEADWWHSNSLSYSPELDQIIISNRNQDEFIIIDHSTTTAEAATSSGGNSGMGGDILYRWGNPQSYRQGTATDQILFGQHNVQFVPSGLPNAGKIMMFNNGNDLTFTSIQFITAPYDATTQNYTYTGGAFAPAAPDSEYVDPVNPDNFHATFLSGAQQLSNGNILICHGPDGRLFEVDSNSNTVWDYQSPVSNSSILSDGDNPSASQTRVFRALRYDVNYPAFAGRDLTPSGVIEQNPATDNCNLLSVNEFTNAETIRVYPTLVDHSLNINTSLTNFTIEIFNLQGQELLKLKSSSSVNVSNLSSGSYLMKLSTEKDSQVFKFIKK